MKIKNLYFIYLLFFSLFSFLSAKTVDSSTSKTVAKNYFALKGQPILPTKEFDVVIENKFNQNITYYIYGFNDGGFVIVSGDDSTIPILGYSLKSKFQEDDIPPALQDLLNHYSEQINYAIESKTENVENLQLWNNLIDFESNSTNNSDINFYVSSPADVNPLISTKWNQGCYYNAMCPSDGAGPCGHVWAGCVATAMAQIMKYWNHPTTGNSSHSYNHPTYGTLSANFGTTTYNWSSMPNSISSNNNAISTLMYHCGVSVDMEYSPSGSGAYSSDALNALKNYFKYSISTKQVYQSSYSSVGWSDMIKNQLNKKYPILHVGRASLDDGGHAFVTDGYSGDLYHINWGWGGYLDGYFILSNLNPYPGYDFSYSQGAIIGINPASGPAPDTTPPAIPTGLSATAGDGYVSLSWNANTEPDMRNYHIFRRTSPTGQEIYIASPPKSLTTYTDNSVTNGTTYYYQICAVDKSDNRSKLCNMVSATPRPSDIIPPSVPTGLSTTAGDGYVSLSWNANTETDLHSYHLYRGTVNGGWMDYLTLVGKNTTNYTDYNVTNGTTYYYRISASDASGNESNQSAQVSVTAGISPSAPTGVVATAQPGSILISWDANPESDVASYWIFKGTHSGNIPFFGSIASSETSFLDNNVNYGTTYYYQIAAYNNDGYRSEYSSIVSASPLTKNVDISNFSISQNINRQVILDWDLNTEYWIDHYTVWRRYGSGGYGLGGKIMNGQSSYIDNGLISGETYIYIISARDSDGNLWGSSGEHSITIWSSPTSQSFTVTIEEDGNYTFKSSDFSFNDADGHSFSGITITQPPIQNNNTITYNQNILSTETNISDISLLSFVPNQNEFGQPYTTFKYKVKDSSADIDKYERSITLNVTPINDLPSTFTLQTPTDNDKIVITKANLLNNYCEFKWTPSDDIDGDQVLYNFIGRGALEFLSTQGLTVPEIKFDHTFICDNIETESVLSGTWTVEATDGIGITLAENGEITFIIDATQMVADKFALDQNFPNPFNTVTSISYDLLNDSKVSLDIYNLTGQHIITLVDELQEKGAKVVQWQGVDKLGRQVDSGIYFYKLQAEDFIQTRKMILLK